MSNIYPQLFKQLYERKYYQSKKPKNSLEKVQLLQKKMHQSETNKTQPKIDTGATNSSACLKDINEDQSKLFMREMMRGNKKPHTQQCARKALWVNMNQDHSESFLPIQQKKRMSYTTGHNQRNYLHKNNPNIVSNQLYHSNQYSILKLKNLYQKRNQSPEPMKSATQRRAKTPSRNVVIGGKNLETEAENVRRQFSKLDKEIEKYQREIQSRQRSSTPKTINHRRKIIRYEKQQNSGKREKIRIKIKQDNQQRQDNIDLRPWAVFPPDHYQYY